MKSTLWVQQWQAYLENVKKRSTHLGEIVWFSIIQMNSGKFQYEHMMKNDWTGWNLAYLTELPKGADEAQPTWPELLQNGWMEVPATWALPYLIISESLGHHLLLNMPWVCLFFPISGLFFLLFFSTTQVRPILHTVALSTVWKQRMKRVGTGSNDNNCLAESCYLVVT